MLNNKRIEVRSEAIQEVLEAVPNWMIRWGNILSVFFLNISWSIKYPDVVPSSIILNTVTPPEKVFASTNGKFDTILVEDGDNILNEQQLAIIENPALYQDVFLPKSLLETITLNRNDFSFPVGKLPPLILGKLNHAIQVANISDHVEGLPPGYNTKIGSEETGWSTEKNVHQIIVFDKGTHQELGD